MATLRPVRALTHPAWWVALGLLVANDHLFKGAGVLPAALTGKLSDFAGLLVAPVVLAALCGARGRRGLLAAHVVVGAIFAAINASPMLAGAWEGLTALTPFPWRVTVDPTDLVALPMLVASWVMFSRWCARPAPLGMAASRFGLAIGALACAATSPPPGPDPVINPGPSGFNLPDVNAEFVLANSTGVRQTVRVRALKPTVAVDCAAASGAPHQLLDRAAFGPAQTWLLDAGRAMPLQADGPCRVLLVDGPELPPRLLFWTAGSFGARRLSTDAARVPADRGLFIDLADGTASWRDHAIIFPAPLLTRPDVDPSCAPVPEGFGVSWSTPPVGDAILLAHAVAPDGCHAIDLLYREGHFRWFACMPDLDWPFADEAALTVSPVGYGTNAQRVEGVRIDGPDARLTLTRGGGLPDVGVAGLEALPLPGCGAARDECGGVAEALSLRFIDGDGESIEARVGESVTFGDTTLTVARAVLARVVDSACSPGQRVGAPYLESVALEHLSN